VPISHLDLYRLGAAPPANEGRGTAGPPSSRGGEYPGPPPESGPAGTLPGEDPALLEDYLGPDTIAFVEWPEGHERALAAHARTVRRVRLSHAGGDRRVVEIE